RRGWAGTHHRRDRERIDHDTRDLDRQAGRYVDCQRHGGQEGGDPPPRLRHRIRGRRWRRQGVAHIQSRQDGRLRRRDRGHFDTPRQARREPMTHAILLHAFGPRYDLPAALSLYLFAAGGVVVLSFVLVAVFAGEKVGPDAVRYPRWRLPFMDPIAGSPVPRAVCGALGVLSLI